MATVFLEPGGDADFGTTLWDGFQGLPVAATDFVHGFHSHSHKYRPAQTDTLNQQAILTDAGGRVSVWFYWNVLPAAITSFFRVIVVTTGTAVVRLRIDNTGLLQLWDASVQQGSSGGTIAAGGWHRITLAWKITSTTVNDVRVYVDGVLKITVTNVTLANVGISDLEVGNSAADANMDVRTSDTYADNSNALTDPGNIWVTAKRPFANGTTTNFTTQIGAGGSGYGSGHAPQVNERALSQTNGWSMVGSGSAITEEYSIEGVAVGDTSLAGVTLVDFMSWVYAKALANETASIICAGATAGIPLTTTPTLFSLIAASTTYPVGGTDVGIITTTAVTTVSLYEAGMVFAYIPSTSLPPVERRYLQAVNRAGAY